MADNAPQDTPKQKSQTRWLIPVLVVVLVAAFVGFILYYPAQQKTAPDQDAISTEPPAEVQQPTGLQVGKPAPDFSLVDTHGKRWTLSKLRGKAVLVNFWATWCPPCRQEMPSIGHLYKLMAKNKNFVIVTILFRDSPDAAKAYFGSHGFGMPILLDPDTTVGKTYGLTGVPETYIVNKQGILVRKDIGPPEGGFDTPEFITFFEQLASQ